MEIRIAQRSDIDTLIHIAIETYTDTFAPHNTQENMEMFLTETYTPARLEMEFSEPGSVYYLAWEGNVAAGYARIRESDEVEKTLGKKALEVQRLYVLPKHKGKKAGSGLLTECLRYAREHGFIWLWLGVWERNFEAQKFYASWGFEKFGEHIFQMGDDPQIDWILKRKV